MNHYALRSLEKTLKHNLTTLRRYLDEIEGSGQPYTELCNLVTQTELTLAIVGHECDRVAPRDMGLKSRSYAKRPRRENPKRGH